MRTPPVCWRLCPGKGPGQRRRILLGWKTHRHRQCRRFRARVGRGKRRSAAILVGHTAEVHVARFSPDGKRIVTASADQTAKVWDAETGHLLVTLTGHAGAIYDANFSSDGKRIATASADQSAKVWDSDSGHLSETLAGHSGVVYNATFSPDGKRVVTASADSTARIWDAETGHYWQL